ncbi:antitoxin [Devosia sp.]|uniref:antitoxin n=1 Tax=Devosia sp. TaxID=1871048 RepID=UPI003F70CAF2
MSQSRTVSLFRNGRNQAVRIPVEFELPGDEATIRKEGNLLIIEAKAKKRGLLEVLREMQPQAPEDAFPEIDDDHLPAREVDL